jgi:hypothetical protein
MEILIPLIAAILDLLPWQEGFIKVDNHSAISDG